MRVRSKIQRRTQKQLPKGYRQSFSEKRGRRKPSLTTLLLLLLVWSICLGWGMAIALGTTVKPDMIAQATPAQPGTVDVVPARYQIGKELYLNNCASCHVALPPEVLPTESWRRVLQDPSQHYGQQLQPMIGPSLLVMWEYIRGFSRPLIEGESIPYRVTESRFFKALHPRVELPRPTGVTSCVTCHSNVAQYDYRTLTPEWDSSP